MPLQNVCFHSNSVAGTAIVQANTWLAANNTFVLYDFEYSVDEDSAYINPSDRVVIRYDDTPVVAFNAFQIQGFIAQTDAQIVTALNTFYNLMATQFLTNARVAQIRPDIHNRYPMYYAAVLYNTNANNGEINCRGQLTRRALGLPYSNLVSGLVSVDVQSAIDEIVAGVGIFGDIVDVPNDLATIELAVAYLNLRNGGIITLSADPPALAANVDVSRITILGLDGNLANVYPTITFNGGSFTGSTVWLKKTRLNVANGQTAFAMTGAATSRIKLEDVMIAGAAGGILADGAAASNLTLDIEQVDFTGMLATIFGAVAAGYNLFISNCNVAIPATPIGAGGLANIFVDDTVYRESITGAIAGWNLITKVAHCRVANRRYASLIAAAGGENPVILPGLTANMVVGANTAILAGGGLSAVDDFYTGWILHITDNTVNPALHNFYRVTGYTGATNLVTLDRVIEQGGPAITCELINPIRIHLEGNTGIRVESLILDKHFILTGRGREIDVITPQQQIVPTASHLHMFEDVSIVGENASWTIPVALYAMLGYDNCRIGSETNVTINFANGAADGGMIQLLKTYLIGDIRVSKNYVNILTNQMFHQLGIITLHYADANLVLSGGSATFVDSRLCRFYQFYCEGAFVLTPGGANAIDDSVVFIRNCSIGNDDTVVFDIYNPDIAMFRAFNGGTITTANARTHSLSLNEGSTKPVENNFVPNIVIAVFNATENGTITIGHGVTNFTSNFPRAIYSCFLVVSPTVLSTIIWNAGNIVYDIQNAENSTILYGYAGQVIGIIDALTINQPINLNIVNSGQFILFYALEDGIITMNSTIAIDIVRCDNIEFIHAEDNSTVLLLDNFDLEYDHCRQNGNAELINALDAAIVTVTPIADGAIFIRNCVFEGNFTLFETAAGAAVTITGTFIRIYIVNCSVGNNIFLYTNVPIFVAAIDSVRVSNCHIHETLDIINGANVVQFRVSNCFIDSLLAGNSINVGGVDPVIYRVSSCQMSGVVNTAGGAVITFTNQMW
jgi:hypothetical protein